MIIQGILIDGVVDGIDWEGVKLQAKDPDWTERGIRVAICIRKARHQS